MKTIETMNANEYFKDHEHRPIFEELARRVGKTLDDIDLGERTEWPYWKYTWTEEEEEDWMKWLTDWMYKNRRTLEMSYASKKMIREKIVPFWVLIYGWKKTSKAEEERG